MSELAGRDVVVVGLGVSGRAAARALLARGARVRVTEEASGPAIEARADELRAAGARVETGGHGLDAPSAELAVVSPGVPPHAPVMRALAASGVEVVSEIELAWMLARCDLLAVTGTNGKTTTTALLAAMLARAGIPSLAAGNIGLPLVEAVERVPPEGAIAVEVSSFQLAAIRSFRPRVAVLLNIAEDHTDWHGDVSAYRRAKARIVMNQEASDFCVANLADAAVMMIARAGAGELVPFSATSAPPGGIGVRGPDVVWRGEPLVARAELALPGMAGLEDSLAAAAAALAYGVDAGAVVHVLRSFASLPHRLQLVAEIDGVRYVDDSKATNPHATLAAVRGLDDVVLIAGGRAKGIDLSPLRATVPPVRAVVALGEAAAAVTRVFDGVVPVVKADSMSEAVARARDLAGHAGSVLLSPGCASLDMYDGYGARGDDFVRAVESMARAEGRAP